MTDRSDRIVAAWLALLLFSLYLFSFSGLLYSQDSMSMFSVTASIVQRGDFDTDQMWTLFKARHEIASNGESYAKYGYGTSLFGVPLYALAFALPGLGLVQTTMLTSAVVIAITGALVFLAARRFKYARGVSVAGALLFGLATPAWVYAKQFWSEPFALFTLFAAFYFLLAFRGKQHARDAVIAGIALGLAVATRVTNAALVPFFAWYGFAATQVAATRAPSRPAPTGTKRANEGRLGKFVAAVSNCQNLRGLFWFALMLALAALSIAWYDWVRYGSPLATGYRADETFDNPILLGLYGLLFSPGKGLFVYVPFLAALPFSAAVFFRRAQREVVLISVIFAFYVLLFSAWYYWWGGTNWGPRFLVPTIPFLVLLVTPAIELAVNTDFRKKAHIAFSTIFSVLCLLSFSIELLGVSVPSLAYRARMVRFAANPDMDAIFVPRLSPLIGSLNLLKPNVLDFAWIRVLDGNVSIDWLVVALTAAMIVLCGAALWLGLMEDERRRTKDGRSSFVFRPAKRSFVREFASSRGALLAMTVALAALSLLSLYRYRDDFRFGGNDGYAALLQVVAREAQPRDVMVLDNDIFAPYFLNEDRARVRWYGLSRDPTEWDESTRALLARLSQQYARVWFAYDDNAAGLPDPARDWLAQSLRQIDQRDFSDGAHLALYTTR